MIRTAPLTLVAARSSVDPVLRSAIGRLCSDGRLVCGYHFGWLDAHGREVASTSGKALRPALTLLSARAAEADPQVAVPGAAAVELVHNFALLHDDVIDRDVCRRHQATAWKVFGDGRAILGGDALLSLACQVLIGSSSPHRLEALERLTEAVTELVRGQQADLAFERRADVSIAECLDMLAGKTAALISCSTAMGAVLAGGSARLVEGLASFGRHLGLAFQGVDDLLGTWGQPATTGKPIGSDLRRKKKTLPVVFTLCGEEPYRKELSQVLSREVISDGDVAHASDLLERSGARQWVTDLVERETALSLRALEALPIPCDVRAELQEVAQFVAIREL